MTPTPGPYSIAQRAGGALGLLDKLGIDRMHFCGLSMGGMTGMWPGAHAPERIDHLILSNTAACIGPADAWSDVSRIDVPTRVIAGTGDIPTPPADSRFLVSEIREAVYAELDGGHLPNQQETDRHADLVWRFPGVSSAD